MLKGFKERHQITNNVQLALILVVFGVTGSCSVKIATPLLSMIGIGANFEPRWLFWIIRIAVVFPVYQILLVTFGFVFGQFQFFWEFEKKMLSRFGLKL